MIGFLATLGITFYDQRNTELYNALIRRARDLEKRLKMFGGQFQTQPDRNRQLLFLIVMGHDTGLALIYGPVLGAWFFPIVFSGLQWLKLERIDSFKTALLASIIMGLLFFVEFLRLDGTWIDLLWVRIHKLSIDPTTKEEIELLENLKNIRKAIASYTSENHMWPLTLKHLVEKEYLDVLPQNPITGNDWCCIYADATQFSHDGKGIVDVRSDDYPLPKRMRLYTNKRGKKYSDW